MRCAANRAAAALLAGALASCRREAAPPPPVANVAAARAAGAVAHGDHNPHHGGVVMMKGEDLHYEVVFDPSGREYRVYFSDAVREELPASVASEVVLTVKRPGAADERIPLEIDDAGESWIGHGRAVESPGATIARLAFSIRSEPYWIDLPFGR